MAINLCLDSDIVSAGYTDEDGMPVYRHCYYIVAEAADGARWQFEPPAMLSNDQYASFRRNTVEAWLASLEKAKEAGMLDVSTWEPIQPRYGSEAYQRNQNRWEFESMDDCEREAYLRRNAGQYPY